MTELALCEKFQVNRETVRNAIAELEFSRVVTRIPGKKGIWANPAFNRMRKKLIGVINGAPSEPYQHHFQTGLLARVTLALETKVPFIYQFPVLSEDTFLAEEQLEMYSFDAILYLHFTSQYNHWLKSMDTLVKKSFPIIAVSNVTDDPLPEALSGNMIGVDITGFAKRRVKYFLENAAPGLFCIGTAISCNSILDKELMKYREKLDYKGFHYGDSLNILSLASRIEKENIRSIYCPSGLLFIRPILELLSSDTAKYSGVTLYGGVFGESIQLQKEYPEANFQLHSDLAFSPERVAGTVQEKLELLLLQGKTTFENVFLS